MKILRDIFDQKNYDYSPAHRALEFTAILVFFALLVVFGVRAFSAVGTDHVTSAWWLVATAALVGYVLADFSSGFVHWMGDTFGDDNTPVLGMSFVKPFRDHHVDPEDITRHDFVEVNGNNCVLLVGYLVPVYLLFSDMTSLISVFALLFSMFFALAIFMTNQFHKWAHMSDPPRLVRRLQSWSLILSPQHHDVHHASPYDTYYCITCGWMNPLLQKLRFFEILEVVVRWVIRSPKTR